MRATVESEAKDRGIRLAAYLRQLAADASREVRRKRNRAGSEAFAAILRSPRKRGNSRNSGARLVCTGCSMAGFTAGDIVIADWRGDALPKEPNELHPSVVIRDEALFAPVYRSQVPLFRRLRPIQAHSVAVSQTGGLPADKAFFDALSGDV